MPAFSSEARFLGVDLSGLVQDTRKAWAHAQSWPLLSWLTPSLPVLLIHPDGSQSHWQGHRPARRPASPKDAKARGAFVALELPSDLVLSRTIRLPVGMSRADTGNALALQARTFSPFPPEDLIWVSDATPVPSTYTLVLASRLQVDQYVQELRQRMPAVVGASPAEVWVAIGAQKYAALPGAGVERRQRLIARQRNLGYALLLCIVAVLTAMAVTPTLQLRMRALQAAAAYEDVVRRTAPVVRDREQVVLASNKLNALSEILGERIEPLRVIDTLTQILPDEAAVQALQLVGTKVSLSGQATDAAELMQKLGQHPGIREVKAPAAATRLNNSNKESFSIEFVVDAKVFGTAGPQTAVAGATQVPGSAAVAPAAATSATSVAPAASTASGAGVRR
ncbi:MULTISPECIES: PilN domain-containing protein [unclassified Acidovorax]|uniref:PilN domain-containing protein n=1 Tax=unclassified Acidovorax TaxID=2684926 RepID=UPI0009EB651C|nr:MULTISPECIES: PilN domain-containing protein [unclassified Acidovorax]